MSQRFFVESRIEGAIAHLVGDEARHLLKSMRGKVGDEVALFDGSGAEFVARIADVRRQTVELNVVERREVSRELDFDLTLAVALPKGDRQKWLVEKATELGVTRLVPLVTERGVAQPVETALARLRRTVIEASKQCGRNRLLVIGEPISSSRLFSSQSGTATRLIADTGGQLMASATLTRGSPIVAAVGPEGGFADAEFAAAEAAGWQVVSLGERILRVETAAIALAALLQSHA